MNGQVVRKAFADECRENMRRREWDVRQFKNRIAQIGLVDASRQGHTNYTADRRQAANLLGDCPVCFSKQIVIHSIAYKTASMTSAKQLLHSIKFRHGGYIHR